MFSLLCHSGSWGSLGNFGLWSSIGLILNLVFWVGLIAVLLVWTVRRARILSTTGRTTAKEILQARYARGEITPEQYEFMKQDIG